MKIKYGTMAIRPEYTTAIYHPPLSLFQKCYAFACEAMFVIEISLLASISITCFMFASGAFR